MAFEEPAGSGRDRTVWPEASMREREQPEPQGAARVTVTLVCAGLGERVKAGSGDRGKSMPCCREKKAVKMVSCVTTTVRGLSVLWSFHRRKR